MRRTEWRRLSAESGFWKTIWSARSSLARSLLVARGEGVAVEQRRARRRRDDPEQRPRERRLAAARLADEPERLAGPDRRADADERVDVVAVLLEHLAEGRRTGRAGGRRGRPAAARGRRAFSRGQLRCALVEVAAALVPAADRDQRRLLGAAALLRQRAAIGEDAAGQLGSERGQEAGNRVEPAVVLRTPPRGMQRSRPTVYGWRGSRSTVSTGPSSTSLAGVEHADALAHLRDHAEVVADEEHGRCGAPPGAATRGRAPLPRPSRRARSSARRGSGAPGPSRAPSRSRRAAAFRPRAGAG